MRDSQYLWRFVRMAELWAVGWQEETVLVWKGGCFGMMEECDGRD